MSHEDLLVDFFKGLQGQPFTYKLTPNDQSSSAYPQISTSFWPESNTFYQQKAVNSFTFYSYNVF